MGDGETADRAAVPFKSVQEFIQYAAVFLGNVVNFYVKLPSVWRFHHAQLL